MDDRNAERHDQLAAAALARELTPDEETELADLDALRPDAARERAELAALVSRLPDEAGDWQESAPSEDLLARVGRIAADPARPGESALPAPVDLRRRRRGRLVAILASAACLALGVGIGAAVFGPSGESAVTGPPGTLGAVETVDFVGAPARVEITGALVAHTWGTETVLRIAGLPAGRAFTVVVIGEDGSEHPAGAMLGSEVTIDCHLNAAVLREDVASVEIRSSSGAEVAHADVVHL